MQSCGLKSLIQKRKSGGNLRTERRPREQRRWQPSLRRDGREGVKVVVQDPAKNGEGCGCVTGKSGVQFQEPRPELKQVMTISAGNQPPLPGDNQNEAGNERSSKKKKEGRKSNNSGAEGGERSGDAQVQVLEAVPIRSLSNQNRPGHHRIGHQYPPHSYYAPPVYTVYHHTAHPNNSYSTAYCNSKG